MRGRPPKSPEQHYANGGVMKGRGTPKPTLTKGFRRLGPPRNDMPPEVVSAWNNFKIEMPWLAESDRAFVEIASFLRAKLEASDKLNVSALSLYKMVLSQMGGTPADRARTVNLPTEEEADDRPAHKYFDS